MTELTGRRRGWWRAAARVAGALVLALQVACMVANPAPGAAPPAAYATRPGCDLGSHPWQQTSPGACGASIWTFTSRPDGAWQAAETGCASAIGIARYDGAMVTLDFQYGGGAGRYRWPLDSQCRSAPGEVSWNAGPQLAQSAPSTLSPAP